MFTYKDVPNLLSSNWKQWPKFYLSLSQFKAVYSDFILRLFIGTEIIKMPMLIPHQSTHQSCSLSELEAKRQSLPSLDLQFWK